MGEVYFRCYSVILRFSATASLGVIHRGHIKESKSVLAAYLPAEDAGQQANTGAGSHYAEGGALYAMGLIHGNHHDLEVEQYLTNQLKTSNHSEVLRHGACLGLGTLLISTFQ